LNKQKFTQIVKDYNAISSDDRKKLHDIAADHPYSQIVHTLVAKANADAKTKFAKPTLAYAAMYATDRSVLKTIIAPGVKTQAPQKPEPEVDKTKTAKTEKPVETQKSQQMPVGTKVTVDTNALQEGKFWLSETVMQDLENLSNSKKKYEDWLDVYEKEVAENEKKQKKSKTSPTKKPASKTKQSKSSASSKEVKSKTTKSTGSSNKKTTASATKTTASSKPVKAKNVEKTEPAKKTQPKSKSTAKSKKKEKSKKTSSKKSKDSPQTDQSELIEKFISKEPSITAKPSRKSASNQEDLSQPSTEFKEDLISENLAKIMISQGKTDKAVDIYKKLIWKFPQKKSYFATQIENLTK